LHKYAIKKTIYAIKIERTGTHTQTKMSVRYSRVGVLRFLSRVPRL